MCSVYILAIQGAYDRRGGIFGRRFWGDLDRRFQESAISAKKRKFASRVRGRSPTSQRLEESVSWVDYNFSLVPWAYHEFGVKPPFGA